MNRGGHGETLNTLNRFEERSLLPSIGLICFAGLAAYSNSFSVPLLFDDKTSITQNPTIRHIASAFLPPGDRSVSGRPLLNFSLALNYAIGGTNIIGYHIFNLAIHIFAGLTLFGIVRQTLMERYPRKALPIAFSIALIWTLHPLQTAAVTYIIQRAELLMGFFYLQTLYCFIRGAKSSGWRRGCWLTLSVGACVNGMGCKEVMVSAPIVVFLYDRIFVAGSTKGALRRRWLFYAAMASTWVVLVILVLSAYGRTGFEKYAAGLLWWRYALTEMPVTIHYLRLSYWPEPLVFDYGTYLAPISIWAVFCTATVIGLLGATIWGLIRNPPLGFLGASFFAVLAPTSSVMPVEGETGADYRMYLPLAAVVTLGVTGLYRRAGRASLPICLAAALALGIASVLRNLDYRSEQALWQDTVAKRPDNPRAHNNLGNALLKTPGALTESISQFEAALKINPNYAEAHCNLGAALARTPGGLAEAIAQFKAALAIDPNLAEAHRNLGAAFVRLPGHLSDAVSEFRSTLKIQPDNADAHRDLGTALTMISGRYAEGISEFEAALRIDQNDAETHYDLGTALSTISGRQSDAIAHLESAIALQPDLAEAHNNLANALAKVPGRLPDAIAHFESAIRIKPNYVEAHNNLGIAFVRSPGRLTDAIAQFHAALNIDPNDANAHFNLGYALLRAGGRESEARQEFAVAIRINPELRSRLDKLPMP